MANSGTQIIRDSTPDTAGEEVTQEYTHGRRKVTTVAPPSSAAFRTATFDAEADAVALSSGALTIVAANLYTFDSFPTGKEYACIKLHFSDGGIPFIHAIVATLNAGGDVTAASRLSFANVGEGGTGSVDTANRMLSKDFPVLEWDLRGTGDTIDRIDLAGIASNLTGTADVLVSIEVR